MDTSTPANLTARIAALSPEKRALLERKLKQQSTRDSKTDTIPRRATNDAPPLSFAQQRLWFLDQLEPDRATYNIPFAVRLQGPLDVNAFRHAVNALVERHEVLRTTFTNRDGNPIQTVSQQLTLPFPILDLQSWSESEREAEALRLAEQEVRLPFDLAHGPLLRTLLVQIGNEDYLLVITMHHIISDGWSMSVFTRELGCFYDALSNGRAPTLPSLPIQYADFAVWQRQQLQGEGLTQEVTYWKQQLSEAPPLLPLPTDYPRPAQQSYRGARYAFTVLPIVTAALKRVSQQGEATLFMTLLAAFQILIARYSGQEDVVVGSPVANRQRIEIEGLIGFFVDTLILRTNLSGSPTFRELLCRVRETALGAYDHQDVPFEKLLEELQVARALSYAPLVQVFFALQNVPRFPLELHGIKAKSVAVKSGTAKFDLSLYIWEEETGTLTGEIEYNTDLFEPATITRMAGHYQMLLEGIIANPDEPITTLPQLTPRERHQLLVEWNATKRAYPLDQSIHQLFEAQVQRTPDATAVIYENRRLTYRELNARANQLAHYLRTLGVALEAPVGLCMERSLDLLVGVLGILKVGAAYLPLDPTYPAERLAFMMRDSQISVLLTHAALRVQLPAGPMHVVELDTVWPTIAQHSPENFPRTGNGDSLAYVLYTSGSTGQPKGVLGHHRGLVNRFSWMWETYPFSPDEVTCQKTALGFIDSLWELLGSLPQGIPVLLLSDTVTKDPSALIEALARHRVTRLVLAPPLLQTLLNIVPNLRARLPKLWLWTSSGEALSPELAHAFRQQFPTCTLLNLYGSSEVTADATAYAVPSTLPRNARIPIGRPIANTKVYVLDTQRQPVPIGVRGELYIGGAGLAHGYSHRPELTAERFVNDPVSELPEARLYKTGDLVRYRPDGNLEFLGRNDTQVKLRGFRIELGEIEAVLQQHPAVQQVATILREDTPGNTTIVTYIVPSAEHKITTSDLAHFLRSRLPEYMIPSAWVLLDALPLNPHGKVDRRALPAPNFKPGETGPFVAPQGTLEIQLAKIWERVLARSPIGVHDNFFDVGGNSLLVVRAVAQIVKTVGKDLSVAAFFQHPTIEGLANVFRQQSWATPSSRFVTLQQQDSGFPFFCISGWVALARYVKPDQSFYMARAYGYDGDRAPSTIEAMACGYLSEVRKHQPEGPYFIGGHSYGGLVAFEMAQQLSRQGHIVALLVLLDPPIGRDERTRFDDNSHTPLSIITRSRLLPFSVQHHKHQLKQLRGKQQLSYVLRELHEKLTSKIQFLISRVLLSAGRRVPLRMRNTYTYNLHIQAIRQYRVKPYSGRTVLFKTQAHAPEYRVTWQRRITQELKVHDVPGSHLGMFEDDHLHEWAPQFAELLQQAQNEYAPTPITATTESS